MLAMNPSCSGSFKPLPALTTEYRLFFPAVAILNIFHLICPPTIRFHNNSSLPRRNVPLNKIICVYALANAPNSPNFGPNLDSIFKITWRSSTTIPSNRRLHFNPLMNLLPSIPNAASRVIKTMLAASRRDPLSSHPAHDIPNTSQRRCIS
jgi:hypothetical protein